MDNTTFLNTPSQEPSGGFLVRHLLVCLLLLSMGSLMACDTVDDGAFTPEYVVQSFLVAGEPLPLVRINLTAPINQAYDATALAVRQAQVRIDRIGANGAVEASHAYREDSQRPGVYLPVTADVVQPLGTYRLEVLVSDKGDRITASTTVPDAFQLVSASADTLVFQGEDQLELVITRSFSPGRTQSYFTFVTRAFDVREEQLTPFALAFYDNQDGDVTLEDLSLGGSPPLNEANYDPNPDGTLTLRYPWLGFAFYGPNQITINALDDNLYDFTRSQRIQQGGSTFSPGEIPNLIEHVTGARGVFGSLAQVSYEVFVLPGNQP